MKTNKRFKIGDLVIITAVVIFILFFFYRNVLSKPAGRRVEITARTYENSFFLNEDRVVEVEGPLGITEVVISEGEVWVRSSPCREKICIKMGRVKRVSEQVVCIPNRVVVEVVGENGRIDGVTR
jgi:hypothetical protein